jgi:release factor glutamine methyltransferase
LIHSDIFPEKSVEKFDIIFSNPPYLSEADYEIAPSLTKKQPKEALVASNNGYFFYEEILSKAHLFVKDSFLIAFEIGFYQKSAVEIMIRKYFPDSNYSFFKDLDGLDRVVVVS